MSNCKTAIVTGASGGIGSKIALKLCDLGFTEIVLCCNLRFPFDLQEEILKKGVDCRIFNGDLGLPETSKKLIDSVKRLDLLVNCAGISETSLVSKTSDEAYRAVMQTNLDSVFYLMRASSELLLKSAGSVINISSVWGVSGASCESVYSASKAGVIGFTQALAKEFAPMKVRVNAIAPGAIDTNMLSGYTEEEIADLIEQIPLGRLGTGEDIAQAVEFLVKCDYITGQTIVVDGGFIS